MISWHKSLVRRMGAAVVELIRCGLLEEKARSALRCRSISVGKLAGEGQVTPPFAQANERNNLPARHWLDWAISYGYLDGDIDRSGTSNDGK